MLANIISTAMFNMIGTLITNGQTCSQGLCNAIDFYIETISQNDSLQSENVDKFIQYFGDKACCDQFKIDFFEIEAEGKNDALYTDASENASNQFFAILLVKPRSANSDEIVKNQCRDYYSTKASKILSHRTLVQSLRLKIKNYLLKIKSNQSVKRSLRMNEFAWIAMSDYGNTHKLITECSKNSELFEVVEKLSQMRLKLFNIFFNHYTIRNSLDTHFIASKLDLIEDALNKARIELSQKIQEIESKSNKSLNEESFNPFIEIGTDHEESKFVSAEDNHDHIGAIIAHQTEHLQEVYSELQTTMNAWLTNLPEPEVLNIGAIFNLY